ncbi:hypothetical protein ACH41E_26430 [Streptomyces sp. NPDC020412]|uniref:hypothetical protein n=1 Tax=Streptomyces sp. NPDC020412 TaxID=3365073 RepID=UPI0037ACF0EE
MHRTDDHRPSGSSSPDPLGTEDSPTPVAVPAMTMRVYRVGVDGTRWPVEREVSVVAAKDVPVEPMKFPPCTCPRCVRGAR